VFVGQCLLCLSTCVAKLCKYDLVDYESAQKLELVHNADQWYESLFCEAHIEDAAMRTLCQLKENHVFPYVVARYGSLLCDIDWFRSVRVHLQEAKTRSLYMSRGKLIFMEHVFFIHPS